jgi:hypothetical protein
MEILSILIDKKNYQINNIMLMVIIILTIKKIKINIIVNINGQKMDLISVGKPEKERQSVLRMVETTIMIVYIRR